MRSRSLLMLLSLLLVRSAARAAEHSIEPIDAASSAFVHVHYPASACGGGSGDVIELEVWSRSRSEWMPHPRHARVAAGACELEDEALLWDEMRWRCARGAGRWIVGLDMFDGGDHGGRQDCGLPQGARVLGDMRIDLRSPAPGVVVRDAEPAATVTGDVLIGGRRGLHYDVVIAVDVSASGGRERVQRQVDAARRFVQQAKDRLGDVRIGLFVHPDPQSDPQSHPHAAIPGSARREIALTDDTRSLEAALDRTAARGPAPAHVASDFAAALSFGMAETQRLEFAPDEGARLYSRRVLLFSGAPESSVGWSISRIDALARSARERGIAVHFFALDGHGRSQAWQPDWVERVLRFAQGSFRRVEPRKSESSASSELAYLRSSGLPYLASLTVLNATTGQISREVGFDETGRFRARVPATFGRNEIVVGASSSLGETVHARYSFEFDGSLVRERLRAGEQARIERLRRERHVEIAPDPSEGR